MEKRIAAEGEGNRLAIFEGSEIRRILVDGEWYYSVVDIIKALTDSDNPRNYWSMLKSRELENGIELSTICVQLKLVSADGKKYSTDCADNEGVLRIIQSVPSKKAEPFKRWLARIGKERLDEIEQPGKAIERAKDYYLAKGYSPQWVQTRIAGIDARYEFTDALKSKKVQAGKEYAILTNEMYSSTFGFTAEEYKKHKGLVKKESLRDNMTPLELASTIFSEATSTEMIKKSDKEGFENTKQTIKKAGKITKEAIEKIEKEIGGRVVTESNFKHLNTPRKQKSLVTKRKKGLK
jgi:DNA-damage-inducible protein D